MPPVVRFAPSPTGSLHLGGLRTALFNYLFAKKYGGKWILRIEDTDRFRFVPGAVDNIRRSLEWAGLEYDYGPGAAGPQRSYFQSERLDLYTNYADKLIEAGHAYHCFCSATRLTEVRDRLKKMGSNSTYDKACLHLSEEEVVRKKKGGEKSVIRLNIDSVPSRSTTSDLIFGTLKDAHESLPTDPILYKSDGYPTYHLASVVDDNDMGVTHVLRGEEWLPSLPLHLDLYSCLGLRAPYFAHLPLLLNPDGSKMSKRKGDASVTGYIVKGWMAPAVLNWLALAGWGSGSVHNGHAYEDVKSRAAPLSTEMLTLQELVERFNLSVLTSRRSILDPKKLEVLNKKHLTRAIEFESESEKGTLLAKAQSLLEQAFGESGETTPAKCKIYLQAAKERINNINELPAAFEFLFRFDMNAISSLFTENRDKVSSERACSVLSKYMDAINLSLTSWDDSTIRKIEELRTDRDELMVLRIALTGKMAGLPLLMTMLLLGRKETHRRLKAARLCIR